MKKRKSFPVARTTPSPEESPQSTARAAATFHTAYMLANNVCDDNGGELSAAAVAEIAASAQALLTCQVSRIPDEWALPAVACHEGCSWCCTALPVSAWPLEVFAIAQWLRDNRSDEQRSAIVARLREAVAERERQRAASPMGAPRVRCPLLDGDRCGVYPVRPASCVGWSAADAAPCEAYAKGDDAAQCKVNPDRMFTARAVPLATAVAVMERGGPAFDNDGKGKGGFVDLSSGLLAVLERGPEALESWLAGATFLQDAATTRAS